MPTMRLGDNERSSIISAFRRVANKAKNNKPFPLTKDDFPEFGYSLLEPRIAKYYEFLREEAEDLTQASTYSPDFNIRDKEYVYKIGMYQMVLPKDGLLLTEAHPMYSVLITWAQEQHDIDERVDDSNYWLSEIVNNCSSTGQIKRVLQDEIIRFVPKYMQDTFKDAERRSRIPAGLTIVQENMDALANILALGSISPDNREGIDATVENKTAI